MNSPWMFITGCMILGWLLPEAFVAFGRINLVPIAMNILTALACGLIAGSFIL